jgi:TonB-linked SusC/RagA family outer membrane protein
MTKIRSHSKLLILLTLFLAGTYIQSLMAQSSGVELTGVVKESGSGQPLAQVAISVSSTGTISSTNEQGAFTISVPDLQAEILVDLPGYNRRHIYLNGRDHLEISLVSASFRSLDNTHNTPLGPSVDKDAVYPFTAFTQPDLALSQASSFDQVLKGRIPGMSVINKTGMPGHRTFMNIRGFSSLYAQSEPLLYIDGMIYDYAYAQESLMEGFALNPFDVLDIEDISDISVLKDGISSLGSAGSTGAIYVNTEQKAEASTVIKFGAYGGINLAPKKQSLMNASQFEDYFRAMLGDQGYDAAMIDAEFPWLNGNESSTDYYKYHNNTDWQDEIYSPASVYKFHFFLKGGDDIATYNISTGYQSHNGIYDNSLYTRFNLRINGKVNITDRFSVTPNAKLSTADNILSNQGPSAWKSATLSALIKPPIMAPIARDAATGENLTYLDDVGVFNISNPVAITNSALGECRNYHFLSSIKAEYRINEHFSLSTLVGINFNNAREHIFLPDLGMAQVSPAYNSPEDFVYEFRSTQNHSALTYTTKTTAGHTIDANVGFRYMDNSYKFDNSTDLNTPSDDFKSLGDGNPGPYSYLASTVGDDRGLRWISYYGDVHYSYRNKYFVSTNLSYDASSVTNDQNRYNFFPSLAAAWRLSSESFLNKATWLEDLKIRGSYSITGNMFSTVYDYSKLYYIDRRINANGALTREAIPNEDLALEKKNTISAGLDLSLLRQRINLHADYFMSSVNNLVIRQELPESAGFTHYYDNGGKLASNGFEVALDARVHSGSFVWIVGGTVSKFATEVTALDFINENTEHIITNFYGGQFITSVGNPMNAYYGLETDGLISAGEAGTITGPLGYPMEEGDIKYVDRNTDGVINEEDKTIIGDPNPDLFGSIFTSLSLGRIELSVTFDYSLGNEVYNYMRTLTEGMSTYANQSTAVLDRWTPSNTGATIPRTSYGDPTGNTVFSDRWIEDGSYVRLGQLTLSYSLPSIAGLTQGVVIYVTATNLLTITDYSGYDPEFAYLNNPFYMGVDYGMMPRSRSFIVGLKLNL